jgi:SAM-dependent methyltransferase
MLAGMATAFGSDLCEEALGLCRDRRLGNLSRCRIEKLPFSAGVFQVILCVDVLYHAWIPDDVVALREMWRVLEPGGMLVVQVAAFECLRGPHDAVVCTRHRYTRRELVAKLQQTGFEVQHITCRNVLLVPVLALMRLFRRREGEPQSNVRPLHPWLNRIALWMMELENAVTRRVQIPLGTSVFAVAIRRADEFAPAGDGCK